MKGLAYFGQSYLMTSTSQRMIGDMRRALFDKLLRLPPAFHAKYHSGDILNRFAADITRIQLAITEAVATYLRDGVTLVVMLVNCFVLDWKLSLIAFGAIPATRSCTSFTSIISRSAGLRRLHSGHVHAGKPSPPTSPNMSRSR